MIKPTQNFYMYFLLLLTILIIRLSVKSRRMGDLVILDKRPVRLRCIHFLIYDLLVHLYTNTVRMCFGDEP
jgi:hypothetical protein